MGRGFPRSDGARPVIRARAKIEAVSVLLLRFTAVSAAGFTAHPFCPASVNPSMYYTANAEYRQYAILETPPKRALVQNRSAHPHKSATARLNMSINPFTRPTSFLSVTSVRQLQEKGPNSVTRATGGSCYTDLNLDMTICRVVFRSAKLNSVKRKAVNRGPRVRPVRLKRRFFDETAAARERPPQMSAIQIGIGVLL